MALTGSGHLFTVTIGFRLTFTMAFTGSDHLGELHARGYGQGQASSRAIQAA
jgi:hypothetical protein